MARNEEKQLARLNRFYLQKDKEAQLKKNPPRPRLETLNTSTEIQKWLPSIKRDLNFYIKQSEVTCYPQSKIDEFSKKINVLKWEYRGFVRKLRELNPGLEVTPWTDRPYAGHKRKAEAASTEDAQEQPDSAEEDCKTSGVENSIPESYSVSNHNNCDNLPLDKYSESINTCTTDITKDNNSLIKDVISDHIEAHTINVITFTPLSTPLLEQDTCYSEVYGYNKPAPLILNANKQLEDLPLEFTNFKNTTHRILDESTENRDEPFNNSFRIDELINNVGTGGSNIGLQESLGLKKHSITNPVLTDLDIGIHDQPLQFAGATQDQPLQFAGAVRNKPLQIAGTLQDQPLQFAGTVQDQPLQCDKSLVYSNKSQTKHDQINNGDSDGVTDQCSFKTDLDNKCKTSSLTHTYLATDNSGLDKNCLKVSSLVIPYSDSESEDDT